MRSRKEHGNGAGIIGVLLDVGRSGHDSSTANVPERRCCVKNNKSSPLLHLLTSSFLNTAGSSQSHTEATHRRRTVTSSVRPETSKMPQFLTFSPHILIVDPCTFASSTVHGDEVFHDATRGLRLASLCRLAVPIARLAAPGTFRTAASAGRVSAHCPSPTAPPRGSPILGMTLASLAWLGRRSGLRPAPDGHHVAAAAVP